MNASSERARMASEVAFLICSELSANGLEEEARRVWSASAASSQCNNWRHFAPHLPHAPLTAIARHFRSQADANTGNDVSVLDTGSNALVPCFRWRPLRYELDRHSRGTTVTNAFTALRERRSRPSAIAPRSLSVCASLSSFACWRGLKVVKGHLGAVWCTAFDPSGATFATGSDDGLVKVWCMSTVRLLLTLRGHTEPVSDIVFSSDATMIASASVDCSIRVWDVQRNGAPLAVFAHQHTDNVLKIAFLTDRYLVSASQDGTGCAFDLEQPDAPAKTVHAHPHHLDTSTNDAAMIEPTLTSSRPRIDPALLAHVPAVQQPHHANAPAAPAPSQSQPPSAPARARGVPGSALFKPEFLFVSVHPQHTEFALSSNDCAIRVFSWPECRLLTVLRAHTGEALQIQYSRSGNRILAIDDAGEVLVWERVSHSHADFVAIARLRILAAAASAADTTMKVRLNRPPTVKLRQAAWNLDECAIFTTDTEFVVRCWRLDPTNHADRIRAISAATGSKKKLSAAAQAKRALMHASLLVPAWSAHSHSREVNVVRAHPTLRNVFATAGEDGCVVLWNADSQESLRVWNCPIGHGRFADASFAPAGDRLLTSTFDGRAWLFGLGSRLPFRDSPLEQFFLHDFGALTRDFHGYVVDSLSNLPPHLMPPQEMIAADGAVYAPQPVIDVCEHGRREARLPSLRERDERHVAVLAAIKAQRLHQQLTYQLQSRVNSANRITGNNTEPASAPAPSTPDVASVLESALHACSLTDEIAEVDSDYDDLEAERKAPEFDVSAQPQSHSHVPSQSSRTRAARMRRPSFTGVADSLDSSAEWLEAQRLIEAEIVAMEFEEELADEDYFPDHEEKQSPAPRSSPVRAVQPARRGPRGGRGRGRGSSSRAAARSFIYRDFDDDDDILRGSSDSEDASEYEEERRSDREEDNEHLSEDDEDRVLLTDEHDEDDDDTPLVRRRLTRRHARSSGADDSNEDGEFVPRGRRAPKRRRGDTSPRSTSRRPKRTARRRLAAEPAEREAKRAMSESSAIEDDEADTQLMPIDPLAPAEPMEGTVPATRAWMHAAAQRYGRFTPQVGDRVIYFRAGHVQAVQAARELAASSQTDTHAPPLGVVDLLRGVATDGMTVSVPAPDVLECVVVDVKFVFESHRAVLHPLEQAERAIQRRQQQQHGGVSQYEEQQEVPSLRIRSFHSPIPSPAPVLLSRSLSAVLDGELDSSEPPSPSWISPHFFNKTSTRRIGEPLPTVAMRVTLHPLATLTDARADTKPVAAFTLVPSDRVDADVDAPMRLRLRRVPAAAARSWTVSAVTVDWLYDGSPDWLVLSSRVHAALDVPWSAGDQFRMYYADVDQFFEGKIVTNANAARRYSVRRSASTQVTNCAIASENEAQAVVLSVDWLDPSHRESLATAWQSLGVSWLDSGADASQPRARPSASHYVSPWEIEAVVTDTGSATDPIQRTELGLLDTRDWSCRLPQSLTDFLLSLVRSLRTESRYHWLNFPVDFDTWHEYLYLIAYPACLAWVEQRLTNSYYRSLAAMLHDVRQIKIAAIEFNQRDTEVVADAVQLTDECFARCKRHLDTAGDELVWERELLSQFAPWQRFIARSCEISAVATPQPQAPDR